MPFPQQHFSSLYQTTPIPTTFIYMKQMTVLLSFCIATLIPVLRTIDQSYTKENDPDHLLQSHVTFKLSYNEITNIRYLHKLFTNLVITFLN